MCKPGQGGFSCAMGSLIAQQRNFNSAINLNALNNGDETARPESLYYFGRGDHTPQDIGSPAHMFQVYDDKYFLLCASGNLGACLVYASQAEEHSRLESTITQVQLNQQIAQTREFFKDIYPTKVYNRAVGIFANAEFIFDGPIDGKRLPTVKIKDLGVVTVHADGTEEYDGPLKKVK